MTKKRSAIVIFTLVVFCLFLAFGCSALVGPAVKLRPAGQNSWQISVWTDSEMFVDHQKAFHEAAVKKCGPNYEIITQDYEKGYHSFELTGVVKCK